MDLKKKPRFLLFKLGGPILVGLLLVIATFYTVQATLYDDISLTDETVADWDDKPVILTDTVGDADPEKDILYAKIASTKNHQGAVDRLNFLVHFTDGQVALPLGDSSIVASLDCGGTKGVFEEPEDMLVVFSPTGQTNVMTGTVAVLNGNRNYGTTLDDLGERITDTIEWAIDYWWLKLPQVPPNPPVDCQGEIGVRFGTATSIVSGTVTIFDLTDPIQWNVPTAVEVDQFSAVNRWQNSQPWLISGVAMIAVAGLGVLAYRGRRRR